MACDATEASRTRTQSNHFLCFTVFRCFVVTNLIHKYAINMAKGENSKKAAGNAKKAEVAAQKQAVENQKKAKVEEQEWSKGAKDSSKA